MNRSSIHNDSCLTKLKLILSLGISETDSVQVFLRCCAKKVCHRMPKKVASKQVKEK